MKEIDQAFRFYEEHYDIVGSWILKPGVKFFLGDKENRHCRFCGRCSPEVSFRKEAHAIPELLGNKGLFSYYECDACNELFGGGIENDFGNWSKPMRMLTRIRGKNRVPTIKRVDGGWRIEGGPEGLNVKHEENDPAFDVDEDKKEITFHLKRDPYTPAGVLKAFVKMGMTLLPEEEMKNYGFALEWIRTKDHNLHSVPEWPIFHTFMPGMYRGDIICLQVFRRKCDNFDVPYAFLCITYGCEMFQVFLPAPKRDLHIMGKSLTIPRFPSLLDYHPTGHGLPKVKPLDLTGSTVVRGEIVTPVMTYDNSISI